MFRKKIIYESMPFYHVKKIIKDLRLKLPDATINSQPNSIFIENSEDIPLNTFDNLNNFTVHDYVKEGLFYEECLTYVENLLKPFNVLNLKILHEIACLNTDPKIISFDYSSINSDFHLPLDIILSVMNDQLIFFTEDYQCLIVCDVNCEPRLESIQNVLLGRLFDRFFALQSDLNSNITNIIDENIVKIAKQICDQETELLTFLAEHCYYDQYTKTCAEDMGLLGIVSAIKFNNQHLREIHIKGKAWCKEVQIVQVAIELSKFLKYDLPKGNLDAFGLKKAADFIVDYTIKYGLKIPVFSTEIMNFLNKRLRNKLNNSYMQYAKQINWQSIYEDRHVKFNINNFFRLYNLCNKSKPTQNIDINDSERLLQNEIQNMKYIQTNEIIEQLIEYIDNNRIGDYIERIGIINLFIQKILNIFSIEDLRRI